MITANKQIHPKQMEAWIAKLQANMQKFLEDGTKDTEKQLKFIRQQYELFDMIIKVLNNQAHFVGCSHSVS